MHSPLEFPLPPPLVASASAAHGACACPFACPTLRSVGMKALAEAIGKGAVPKIVFLNLRYNKIGDNGMMAFAEALGKGALPMLECLYLNNNNIGDEGANAFADALGNGALPRLLDINLMNNQIGDQGIKAFLAAVGNINLSRIHLLYSAVDIFIGD